MSEVNAGDEFPQACSFFWFQEQTPVGVDHVDPPPGLYCVPAGVLNPVCQSK